MIEIKYNGADPFKNICPTPYVEFSKNSDGWWKSVKNFKLYGEIYCCGLSVEQIKEKQQHISKHFLKNFKNFQIVEDNVIVLQAEYAFIKNIDFEESNYTYVLPFTIEIEAYDYSAFGIDNFVVEPVLEWSIDEEKDGLVKYALTASAKGIRGNNTDPIDNAANWVNSIFNFDNVGNLNITVPSLSKTIIYCNPLNPSEIIFDQQDNASTITIQNVFLESNEEYYDRLEGTYRRVISFTLDPKSNNSGTKMTYNVTADREKNDFFKVTVDGTIKGNTIEAARSRLNRSEISNIASSYASGFIDSFGSAEITSDPKSFNITENLENNSISFSFTYTSQNNLEGYLKTGGSYNGGSLSSENSKISATVTIEAYGTEGTKEERYQTALRLIETANPETVLAEIIGLANTGQSTSSTLQLVGTGLDTDENEGTVKKTYTYESRDSNKPCEVQDINGTIEEEFPCQQYNFKRTLCEDWVAIPTHISTRKKRANLTVKYSAPNNKSAAMAYTESLLASEAIGTNMKSVKYERDHDSQVVYEYEWEEIQQLTE